jgi:carnitine O-acetyltransferase
MSASSHHKITNGQKRPAYKRVESGTFFAQGDLPRLPIPTLNETLDKLPKVLYALQDAQQREETKRIIQDFRTGDGPKLQELLNQYEAQGRADGTLGSYVEEFWNDSYLAPDESVVLNLNPYFVLEEGPDPKISKNPILRAASLCYASVKLASLLRSEDLEPDIFKGQPLCMDQFRALFGACRIPEKGMSDAVSVYPDSSHVCVLTRSQFYYFQVLWPDGTVAVDEADIADILHSIHKHSKHTALETAGKDCLGVLTSLPRQDWATARQDLIASSKRNDECLQIVDSALFILVLDDYVPQDVHETASNMLHGTYKLKKGSDGVDYQIGTSCNRWYDKLQIIVCGDGSAGINFEHSAIDGHTALRFVSDIYAETVVKFAQSITRPIHGKSKIPHVVHATVKRAALELDERGHPRLDVFPKKLVFELPASVKERIYYAETALGDQIVASDNVVLEFRGYGKSLIIANQIR